MFRKFVSQFQDAVHASDLTVKELAAELDKAPSTLYAELNPASNPNSTHKLGVEDAVRIMEITKDYTPLLQMAHHLGFTLHRNNRQPDARDMNEECLQGFQATARFIEAAQNGASLSALDTALL